MTSKTTTADNDNDKMFEWCGVPVWTLPLSSLCDLPLMPLPQFKATAAGLRWASSTTKFHKGSFEAARMILRLCSEWSTSETIKVSLVHDNLHEIKTDYDLAAAEILGILVGYARDNVLMLLAELKARGYVMQK
jgi:hypothetical protein